MRGFHRSAATRLAAGFLSAGLLSACLTTPGPSGDIYLVRHAEKAAGDDPGLTEAGRRRAAALSDRLSGADLVRIYSTDTRRTRETAAPTAARTGLEVDIYDPTDLRDLARTLRAAPGDVLVVGHSDTTPALVERLGGAPGPEIDEAREFDRLYIISPGPRGTHTELQSYGVHLSESVR